MALAALGATFLGAAFGAGVGAGAGADTGLAASHCSGKLLLTIDVMRCQDPKGLFATIYLIGLSSAALYSATDSTLPLSAK